MPLTNTTKAVGLGALCAAVLTGVLGYQLSNSKITTEVGATTNTPALSSELIADVKTNNPIGNRTDYDFFSWASFVALNWPPGPNGEPDPNKTIGEDGDNETVWGNWMEDFQFLVKAGDTPPIWGGPRTIPSACTQIGGTFTPRKILSHATKSDGVVGSFNQAQAGPLIDLNTNYVRYEILFNKPMYDYMVDNKLYDINVLKNFGKVSFPEGSLDTGTIGAIMVKAAWKIIGNGDDASSFHTTKSYIYNETNQTCSIEDIGLVGLHISTKTKSAPQWIWSTFEHKDNVPEPHEISAKKHFSFFDPNCSAKASQEDCKPNLLPQTPWDPTRPNQIPVQATRIIPIDPNTKSMSSDFQTALKSVNQNSVWANYILVGTQYPQVPGDATDDTGQPFPEFLANATMETFLQGQTPPVSSNCIGCHLRATTSVSSESTDFAYILSRVPLKD
ncbi:MAG: hypothetical protein WBC71_10385 [Salaquimonas sp.]